MNEELKIIIRAELEQFKKAMRDAVSGLKSVANESKKASKEIDGFTADVNQQGKALSDLKRKYIDLAAAHGKESKEAKDAAEQIKKLSAEYKTNKQLAADLANQANSFDLSLGSENTHKNIDKTNESAEDLSGTLSDIASLNFGSVLLQMVSPAVVKGFSQYADWMEEYRSQMELAKQALDKNSKYYSPQGYNNDWEGDDVAKEYYNFHVGEAKEAMEKTKAITKNTMKEVGGAVKSALKGIVGALIIVAVDIAAIVALAKNALNVAKQIKTEAAEASKLGLTTQAYQEWSYVLEQVGVGADKLSDFLKTLADEQNAVRDGSEEVVKAFEDIGLTQEQVMGMDQQTLFQETVRGLQNIENATERTSIAYRIFGEDAAELANVLYLNNQETQSLISNYYNLGAAPTDNLISKSKILTGSTTNLSYAWQGLRNTLAEWVIPAVIAVVQWLTTAVAYINAFLQGIFGIKTPSKDASKGLESISGGVSNIGTNAKKATDAVKELLRYTMGFDELNIIPKQSTGGGSGGSDASTIGGGYGGTNINPEIPVIETPDLSKFRAFMDEYGSIIQGILTWATILGGIVMITFGFMNGNIPLIVGGFSVAGLGIAIGAAGGEESHWAKIGDAIKKAWTGLKNWFGNNIKWWSDKWNEIKDTVSKKMDETKQNIDGKIAFWKEWYNTNIAPFFTKEYWSEKWNNIKKAWNDKISEIKKDIDMKIEFWKNWYNTNIAPLFTKEYWSNKWNNIKQAASEKIAQIKQTIENGVAPIKNWFNNSIKPIFTVEYWKNKWNTVKEGAKSSFNGIIEIVERAINQIIRKINTLSWQVPDWVPVIGGERWGFNFRTISIPRLAEGGIATSSVLANIGERGREAVLPLENNTEWMDVLAARINGRSPSRIVLMVDGRELGYAAIDSINNITRQTGTIQLNMV